MKSVCPERNGGRKFDGFRTLANFVSLRRLEAVTTLACCVFLDALDVVLRGWFPCPMGRLLAVLPDRSDILGKGEVLTFTTTRDATRAKTVYSKRPFWMDSGEGEGKAEG